MSTDYIPQHVAFIMDGNRRWAKEHGIPTLLGHKKGFNAIEKIIKYAGERGISFVTFWAFSTENWNRSEREVSYLISFFRTVFKGKLVARVLKEGGKIVILGDITLFPEDLQKMMKDIVEKSKKNTKITINIGLNYGGREEILSAVKKILTEKRQVSEITQEFFSKYIYTKNIPDPDLIVRTGGEKRLSGFLTWQSIYSELYFTDCYWPDFDEKEFGVALEEYKNRERRFGK